MPLNPATPGSPGGPLGQLFCGKQSRILDNNNNCCYLLQYSGRFCRLCRNILSIIIFAVVVNTSGTLMIALSRCILIISYHRSSASNYMCIK